MDMTNQVKLLIGEGYTDAAGGRTFSRRNPVSTEVASIAAAADVDDAERAALAAQTAFPIWSAMGPNARRRHLEVAAQQLEARAEAFVDAMMTETGSTEGWARFNLMLAVGMVREAAALTTQIQGQVIPSDKPGCVSMALREPVGPMLGIAPWNAPIILGVRAIAVPLACGNTVVLKSSERCPRTHGLIVDAFHAAGLPAGTVNAISNAPEDAGAIVGALIDHPAIKRINFTGSTAVGRVIAERAGRNLKPCLLELGGKAPFIVLADADLEEAVKAAAFGAYMNQGQICMSTERIIVVDAVADAFAEKLGAKVRTLASGDPRRGETPLGAVIDASTSSHCRELIDDALAQGAELLAGGDTIDDVIMPAHLLDKVTPAMRLFREESFGPVVGIVRARDTDHAIELANDTEYGLSAAVFTRDVALGLQVARQVRSGICHINGPTVHDEPQMPFGGVGASGYGRFGGQGGIDSFTEIRWVTIETQAGYFPF